MHPIGGPLENLQCRIDIVEVGAKRADRKTQDKVTIDFCGTDEYSSVVLNDFHQPTIKSIRVSIVGYIAIGNH